MTLTVMWETDAERMVRCNHEGTTEPLGSGVISFCTECGKTWPARFGAGAATVQIVRKSEGSTQGSTT